MKNVKRKPTGLPHQRRRQLANEQDYHRNHEKLFNTQNENKNAITFVLPESECWCYG